MSDPMREMEEPIQGKVRAEHRRIYDLLRQLREAFHRGDDEAGVVDAFTRLRQELELHFDQEDRAYYQPLAREHPELKPSFDDFAEEHVRFRRELAAIAEQLDGGKLEDASSSVVEMAIAFERHETDEEELLRRLDREG